MLAKVHRKAFRNCSICVFIQLQRTKENTYIFASLLFKAIFPLEHELSISKSSEEEETTTARWIQAYYNLKLKKLCCQGSHTKKNALGADNCCEVDHILLGIYIN